MRSELVLCRCLALTGRVADALGRLERRCDAAGRAGTGSDQVALRLLIAELLYLEGEHAASFHVFTDEIEPLLPLLPDDVRLIVEDNRTIVALQAGAPNVQRDLSYVHEGLQIIGTERWDAAAMLRAHEAGREGRRFESLPLVWRELWRSYRRGCWKSRWWATSSLSRECLALGQLDEASVHAVMALDEKLGEEVATQLVACRDGDVVSRTVARLLACANLRRHSTVACEILRRIGDAVPDAQIDDLFQWLLARCRMASASLFGPQASKAAWRAARSIAARLSRQQARELVDAATSHEAWKSGHPQRQEIIETVNAAVSCLPTAAIGSFAREAVCLVGANKQDHDYVSAVNLLCHLAHRGNKRTRGWLAQQLFPPGEAVNLVFAQVAPLFGENLADATALNKTAEAVAANLLLQVQHVMPDEDVVKVSDSFGTVSQVRGKVKTVVQMASSQHHLAAMVVHRKSLKRKSVKLLVDASLAMLAHPDNVLTNKLILIDTLGRLADRLAKVDARRALQVLLPLAEGRVEEPSVSMSAAEARNPLNPFRMHAGDPADVQGAAMRALVRIESAHPGIYGARIIDLVERGVGHPNDTVRMLAFDSIRFLPNLADSIRLALFVGIRDVETATARAALAAIASRDDLEFSGSEWRLLLYSLVLAQRHPDPALRRAAATVVARTKEPSDRELVTILRELKAEFANDVCHSVRVVIPSRRTVRHLSRG